MDGSSPSAKVSVPNAVVTLIASLGVAWITAGTTFDEKFNEVRQQYEKMRDTLHGYDVVQARADEQLKQLQRQVGDVEDSLDELNRRLVGVRHATEKAEVRLADVNEVLAQKQSSLAALERQASATHILDDGTSSDLEMPVEEGDTAASPPDED